MKFKIRRYHETAVFWLKKAIYRFADRDDECIHVENADHASGLPFSLARLCLQLRSRRFGGSPASRLVASEENRHPVLVDELVKEVNDNFDVVSSLGIASWRRFTVDVGVVDVAYVQFAEVG